MTALPSPLTTGCSHTLFEARSDGTFYCYGCTTTFGDEAPVADSPVSPVLVDVRACDTCGMGVGAPLFPKDFPHEVCACIPDPEPTTLFAVPSPTEAAQSHARKVLAMVRYAHKRMEEAGYPLGTLPTLSRDLIARAAADARTDEALMDLVIETAICTARS